MRIKPLWIGLAAMGFALPAISQSIAGSSIVNGRQVDLLSDFTWKYKASTPENCVVIKDNVSFCGANLGWESTSNTNKDVAALYKLDDRNYGLFIVEEVGRDDGIIIFQQIQRTPDRIHEYDHS